jgi:hypothetical protein
LADAAYEDILTASFEGADSTTHAGGTISDTFAGGVITVTEATNADFTAADAGNCNITAGGKTYSIGIEGYVSASSVKLLGTQIPAGPGWPSPRRVTTNSRSRA